MRAVELLRYPAKLAELYRQYRGSRWLEAAGGSFLNFVFYETQQLPSLLIGIIGFFSKT